MAVIVHLSSVHPRTDSRVFLKECRSLAGRGHRVTLLVADGLAPESRDGVRIESVRPNRGRLGRMLVTPFRLLRRALALRPELCHLHDPELIPVGLLLKLRGIRVLFDAHEDLPKQIMAKPYLPRRLRGPLAAATGLFLRASLCWLDGLVAATPAIRDRLLPVNGNCLSISNYPIPGELAGTVRQDPPGRAICYVGGITEVRGIIELVQALALLPEDVRLKLAGPFQDAALAAALARLPGWSRVDYLGVLDRAGVAAVLAASRCGIATLRPAPNHLESQPIKLFEYMSAGLPVVASDFPLWRGFLLDGACGLCVDPMDPQAIAEAIQSLLDQPERAAAMGRIGQQAVRERFNWAVEADRLGGFYDQVLGA